MDRQTEKRNDLVGRSMDHHPQLPPIKKNNQSGTAPPLNEMFLASRLV